jgi:subtilisin family serine protease
MKLFCRPYAHPTRPNRPFKKLSLDALEHRHVPSATFDASTIIVGFRTADPADPVEIRTVPVTPDESIAAAVAAWQQTPGVAYAEPNYTYTTGALPNDTFFRVQYAQHNTGQSGGTFDADMDAPEAWSLTTGSTRTTVAVIDTGVDYAHEDLYRNIWLNQVEIPSQIRSRLSDVDGDGLITFWDLNNSVNIGAGKITDLNGNGRIDGGDVLRPLAQGGWADGADAGANGYTDDLVGWDFLDNDNDPMDLLSDDGGHGTHVAGTIGAIGNNGIGVAGVAWAVQMMPVRFIGADGGSSIDAAAAIRYAAANGAVVSNNSWGGGDYSRTIYDAIAFSQSRGQVFVVAAGNESADNDTTASYPANLAQDNIVSVAATDRYDQLAYFSNYGHSTVDLAAPGVRIGSTYPGDEYVYFSGTSMAAPQVTGVFALLYSQNPSLNYAEAIRRVLTSVDPIPGLSDLTVSGGRVNARSALGPRPAETPTGPGAGTSDGSQSSLSLPLVVSGGTDGTAVVYSSLSANPDAPAPVATLEPFGDTGGNVRSAVGDVNGDEVPDTILVTGPGTPTRFAVVSGRDNRTLLVSATAPFAGSEDFSGGGFVTAGDFDGDGRAEIVITPDRSGGPRVTIFRLLSTGLKLRANFFGIDEPEFRGGARAAAGDVNGDSTPDLAVAAGFLGGPRVGLFNGMSVLGTPERLVNDFFAFPGDDVNQLRNGVFAAIGDVDGDGFGDLIFGGGPGGAPRVFILSGKLISAGAVEAAYDNPLANFFVGGNSDDRGGVRVAATHSAIGHRADLVVGSGEGSPARVRVYLAADLTAAGEPATFEELDVFGGAVLPGGVFVG